MRRGVGILGEETVRLIEADQERLATPTHREFHRREECLVHNASQRAHDDSDDFCRYTGDVEDGDRLGAANPGGNKFVEIRLDSALEIWMK